ncbi:type VI secretion system contractile sheath small subunit [Edwardsiella piscicida]|uniref:EvpA n=1 Tax=Edwardsiella tarda TaxID=636 RepID=Q6EE21_EDWTA|nr:type VI secretion system contractile sheath small subunit [Edwardsiella piscicida]AAR83927.1 EvpA [Edwardsiella tarda]AOP43619.1 type VI secretion system contractile sheath small subunit [Edwardsiella piscicida]EKS7766247.1 type VI secretion system contractile sheath small subunit [Edwardsiella piscicida]EKS7779802.1 type VI secretion system contractile sheath small subunit [Edwardsiella piscicida]EKS7783224.1 type VI secretion system contractile sheath small subunit [Edwardsiella piscicida
MASESKQHTLDRVRSPRVQITYDVEIGDAQEMKELPFVMGVLGDYSGQPATPLPKLKERKFVSIDRDNFNDVIKGVHPHLSFRTENTLSGDDSQLSVDLHFQSMADFTPERVAAQVEPLRKLMDIRSRLSDLKNKMYSNERLGEVLQGIIEDTEKLQSLGKETGFGEEKQP